MFQELVFHVDGRDYRELESAAALRVAGSDRRAGPRTAASDWSNKDDVASAYRLLSASEAAERMGISAVRLREISDFYWELVDMGCRPFGRPPVRVGSQSFYATETLKHWFGDSA